MTDYLHLNMSRDELLATSSLGLAHLGDAVFELMVRGWIAVHGKARPKDLHKATVGYVSAPAQAAMAERILPALSEAELGWCSDTEELYIGRAGGRNRSDLLCQRQSRSPHQPTGLSNPDRRPPRLRRDCHGGRIHGAHP